MVIGYYVHHHGAGHLTRARVIAGALRARGTEVVLLGSNLRGTDGVTLPPDADEPPFTDPGAGGALHWAPLRHPGYSARMAAIAAWVGTRRPSAMVVDVSVEVATLVRLLGVPTVVVAQPGDRGDQPHTLAYRSATAILAPWPAEARPCPALHSFADKVNHTGGISGVAPRPRVPRVGVLLTGRGDAGENPAATLVTDLRAQLPGLEWVEAGAGRWVEDVGSVLAQACVVVGHCGQNVVADVAAIDVPAVLYASPRPHVEQVHLAAELFRLGLATVVDLQSEERPRWAHLVEEAVRRPSLWPRWGTAGAPSRAADVLQRVADA